MATDNVTHLHLRLYKGKDDDLIEWAEGLSRGTANHIGKDVLRRGLGFADGNMPPDHAPAATTLDTRTLSQIRRVVERACEDALRRFALRSTNRPLAPQAESQGADESNDDKDETEDILEALDGDILLSDE